jgi:tetratricopeptide (TPR) repeat protein
VWRQTVGRAGADETGRGDRGEPAWQPDEIWIDEGSEERADPAGHGRRGRSDNARSAPARNRGAAAGGPTPQGASGPAGHRHSVPRPVVDELAEAAGATRGARLAARLAEATHAYDHERYQEARRILRPLADQVPKSAAVQELYGLVLYRSGQWAAAAARLERYRALTGEVDQHPVLADCYRALRRYDEAEQLWEELRRASPDADLVAEGRIVAAGIRADQGDLSGAVALLERSLRRVDRPTERHLRQWYVLGDLAERAGDLPRARSIFAKVAAAEPDAYDVTARLRALR